MANRWYLPSFTNAHDQGLVADETTGDNIAVVYDKKNAPLIAAAPELLSALQYLVDIAVPDQKPILMLHATEKARAAIEKATTQNGG